MVLLIQVFQRCVLGRQAALGSHVHHQHDAALKAGQGQFIAVEGVQGKVVKSTHDGLQNLGIGFRQSLRMPIAVGCTDEKNRYEIIEIIRSFAQNFKKVFVITHIEELKDVFDQKIVIENNFEGNKILLV